MQHEFEDSVAAFEDDLDELRDLRRRTAEVVARLGASVPELLAATQKLRRHADDLEDELREASGEAPHPTTPRRTRGRQDAALTRAAPGQHHVRAGSSPCPRLPLSLPDGVTTGNWNWRK